MDWYNSGSRPGKPKSKNPRRRRTSKKEDKGDPENDASEGEEELELSVGKEKLMSVESSPRTMENNPGGDDTESGNTVKLGYKEEGLVIFILYNRGGGGL
jgi:hypothetical protein